MNNLLTRLTGTEDHTESGRTRKTREFSRFLLSPDVQKLQLAVKGDFFAVRW